MKQKAAVHTLPLILYRRLQLQYLLGDFSYLALVCQGIDHFSAQNGEGRKQATGVMDVVESGAHLIQAIGYINPVRHDVWITRLATGGLLIQPGDRGAQTALLLAVLTTCLGRLIRVEAGVLGYTAVGRLNAAEASTVSSKGGG